MIEVFGSNVLLALSHEFIHQEELARLRSMEAAKRFFDENQSISPDASGAEQINAGVPCYPAFDLSGLAVGVVQACGSLVNPPAQEPEVKPRTDNIFLKQFAALTSHVSGMNAPVEVGDKVLFKRYGATPIPLEGADHLLIVEASNIVARLKTDAEE